MYDFCGFISILSYVNDMNFVIFKNVINCYLQFQISIIVLLVSFCAQTLNSAHFQA